jgi:DNA-binding CsgD family transcriptional regulator/PAS domain-containing protein
MISPQALSELIGSIYDCALDPSRWEQTLPDLRDALECHILALHLTDLRHHRFLLNKTVGFEPYQVEQTTKYLPEINAVLGGALASWPSLNEPHVVSRHLSTAYIETSPYFQEWVKPAGIVDMMVFFLMRTPIHWSGFGVGRNERQGIITEREIELGKLLLPHLRRAVTISKVLDVRTIERARMAEALDALRCAVVLTNEHGTILHANRSAEHMLREGGAVQSVQGILQATAPSAASELRSAFILAARNEASIGKTGLAIRLTEPDMSPIFAHVLPLTGSDFRTRLQPAAVAAVFIGAPPDEQDGADAVAAAFGLTPAETRVLASLFAGRTLGETAATLGIAGTTAKTHLEHIFLKTGVTRQAELMRLWAGLTSPTQSNM